jgi:peptidoglycan/LPS O-acetylase OafA/YrhL
VDKEEARRIADALLAKERRARKWNPRVPFFLRSPDSARLDRQREWALFRDARGNVVGSWGAALALVLSPILIGCLFLFFEPHPTIVWYTVAWICAGLVPEILALCHVRGELARLAREEPD